MKRNERNTATASVDTATTANEKSNGHSKISTEAGSADFTAILASLQTMRDGDFSVRLPGSWTGLAGKIADTFNEIVAANAQKYPNGADEKRVQRLCGRRLQSQCIRRQA